MMKYLIKFNGNVIADLGANDPITPSLGIVVNGKPFSAPPGWIARPGAVIPGYTIEEYLPTPPPSPVQVVWRVDWLLLLSRLTSDANADALVAHFVGLGARYIEPLRWNGVLVNTMVPTPLETVMRNYLPTIGEDPAVILAVPA